MGAESGQGECGDGGGGGELFDIECGRDDQYVLLFLFLLFLFLLFLLLLFLFLRLLLLLRLLLSLRLLLILLLLWAFLVIERKWKREQ